jgi:hypothetical protein
LTKLRGTRSYAEEEVSIRMEEEEEEEEEERV